MFSQSVLQDDCGDPYDTGVGPYDYTDAADRSKGDRIPIVEKYHFDSGVESLERGMSSVNVMDDIEYTLRAVPNHHRALYSAGVYQLRVGAQNMQPRSVECYFSRALAYRPQDEAVRLLFGIFLHKSDKFSDAEVQYLRAIELNDAMAEAYYNLGLLYEETGRADEALTMAQTAYGLGYPLQGLKQKLIRAGVWEQAGN